MSTCGLIGTIAKECLDAVGGVKTFYVAEFSRVSSVTQNASGQVTAISMVGNSKFLEYAIEKGVGKFTWPSVHSPTNGTTSYAQNLTVPMNKVSNLKDYKLKITGYNTLMIIVKLADDTYRLMGLTGANMISGGGDSGDVVGSKNGYNLVFAADEPSFPPEIDSAAVTSIITAAI